MLEVDASWHGEDLCGGCQWEKWILPLEVRTVNLFQSKLLRLSDEAEYHDPGDEIEPSVEADCFTSQ